MAEPKKKLGELLLELGLIDRDQLTSALAYQRQWGQRLGAALVAKAFISEDTLVHVLARSLSIPLVDLSLVTPNPAVLKLVPALTCETHEVVPLMVEGNRGRKTLVLAMADPLNIAVQEEVGFTTGHVVRPVIASGTAIRLALRAWIRGEPGIEIPRPNYNRPHTGRDGEPRESMTLVHRGGEVHVVTQHSVPPMPLPVSTPPAASNPAPSSQAPTAPLTGFPALGPSAPGPAASVHPTVPSNPFHLQAPFPPQPSFGGPTTAVTAPSSYPHGHAPAPVSQVSHPIQQAAAYPGQVPGAPRFGIPSSHPQVQQVPAVPWQVTQPPLPPVAQLPLHDPVEDLEKKFWALMRVLAKRGLITKDEFLRELDRP